LNSNTNLDYEDYIHFFFQSLDINIVSKVEHEHIPILDSSLRITNIFNPCNNTTNFKIFFKNIFNSNYICFVVYIFIYKIKSWINLILH